MTCSLHPFLSYISLLILSALSPMSSSMRSFKVLFGRPLLLEVSGSQKRNFVAGWCPKVCQSSSGLKMFTTERPKGSKSQEHKLETLTMCWQRIHIVQICLNLHFQVTNTGCITHMTYTFTLRGRSLCCGRNFNRVFNMI